MTVKELMERVGVKETGRVVAYIKDGLEEINVFTETHSRVERLDVTANQRFYEFPKEMVKVIDIRRKNHRYSKGEYRSIPRLLNPPIIKDEDGV